MTPVGARRFSSSLVPFVLTLVRRHGADGAALERRYLHARPSAGQAAEVSLAELQGVLEDAAKLVKDPLFGLHCAVAMPRGSYGLLEFALRCAPTARRAVEQLAAYGALINPLCAGASRWTATRWRSCTGRRGRAAWASRATSSPSRASCRSPARCWGHG